MNQLTMYDSVTVADIPSGGNAVAGYVGGLYPTWVPLIAKFPHLPAVSIAVNASQNAQCLDVERGDATPADVPGWLARQAKLHPDVTPILYTSASQVDAVRKAAGSRPHLIWSAHYTGRAHICGSDGCTYPKADATQYFDKGPHGEHFDVSLMSPAFFAAIVHRGAPAALPKEPIVSTAYDRVTWRGYTFDKMTVQAIEAAERIYGGHLMVKQGCYNPGGVAASAGTHDGGGAVDVAATTDPAKVLHALRAVGFAAWHRLPSQGPWAEHIHAVLNGNAKLSPAAAQQVAAYKNGHNGLANNLADPTPRPSPIPRYVYKEPVVSASQPAAPVVSTPYSRTRARIADAVNHPDAHAIAAGRVRFRAFLTTIRAALATFKKN